MRLKLPEERKVYWTQHSKMKMRQYRFSEKRVLKIFRRPDRVEEGIAEGTIAAMQITGTKKNPTEAWVMYVILRRPKGGSRSSASRQRRQYGRSPAKLSLPPKGIKIISAWRYPGRTPMSERPVIPEDTLNELSSILKTG